MDELIARLEKATGPDRELDVTIWAAITDPKTYRRIEPGKSYSTWQIRDRAGEWADYYPELNAKHYTASIDAALTLVSEGWRWQVGEFNVNPGAMADLAEVGEIMNYGIGIKHRAQAKGSTAAIALCIAALKARSQHISGA